MSIISTSERNTLNTHPQQTKLYLSIYKPSLALMGQASGVYDASNQSLTYTAISGSYTNIQDYHYQVAMIGSTPGADDLGRTWVRSATNTTLRFVESDHINWNPLAYITVLKYTEIIPVFPRIIQNPSNEEDVIFYKVWDIPYSNQNSILGTFICMGSNYAGFLTTGSCQVYWSASGTSNLVGDSLTHSWIFEGATVTGSTVHTPGNITYTTPGHYRTIYKATSSSGRVDTSIRYVSIYDRPGVGPNTPYLNWELSELSGSRESIGYSGRIRVRENISTTDIIDGALVVIFKEDWYGNVKQSISKNAKGRESILFSGYINGGTIQYDYNQGWVEFEVISPTNLMEITECFSVSVESKLNPTVWYELLNMDVRRAVYHYLAWHSSVLLCCDFEAKNLDDRYIQYFDADRTSLYDAVNSVLSGALRGKLVSDSLGKLWAEREIAVIDTPTVVLPAVFSLSKADWIDMPTIDERQVGEVSFIEYGGIAYNPASSESTPLLASAPGSAPSYRGKVERSQGFALEDQTELNTMVGNMYAYMNARYPNMDVKLRGNFSNFDIAPQELVHITINANDNPRRLSFSAKPFAIRTVTWNWNPQMEVLQTSLQLAEVTQGFTGASIVIPIEPPDSDGGGGGSVSQPPVTVPPIPPVVYPATTGTTVNVYENGVFKGMTRNLNFAGPIVKVTMSTLNNNGETVANIYYDACGCSGSFYNGVVDPTGYNLDRVDFSTSVPWTDQKLYLNQGVVDSAFDLVGPLQAITGSSTFQVDRSGMFDITFAASTLQVGMGVRPTAVAPCGIDMTYTYALYIEGESEPLVELNGSYSQAPDNQPSRWPVVVFPAISSKNHYFEQGQEVRMYVYQTIADLCGTLDGMTMGLTLLANGMTVTLQGY